MSEADFGRLLGAANDRFGTLTGEMIQCIRAEIQAVERAAGGAAVVETFANSAPTAMLHLVRPVAAVNGVTERRSPADAAVLLALTDYRLLGRWQLVRTRDGANPASTWGAEVVISYAAEVDQDLRDRVVLDLVALDEAFRPLRSETLPDFAYTSGDQSELRRQLLAQLNEGAARATVL